MEKIITQYEENERFLIRTIKSIKPLEDLIAKYLKGLAQFRDNPDMAGHQIFHKLLEEANMKKTELTHRVQGNLKKLKN
jgi:hypothetical protein